MNNTFDFNRWNERVFFFHSIISRFFVWFGLNPMEILGKKMWHRFNPLAIATFTHMHWTRRVSYINGACKPWIWFEQMCSFPFDDDTVQFDHYVYYIKIFFLQFLIHFSIRQKKKKLFFAFFALVKSIVTNTKSKLQESGFDGCVCACIALSILI